MSMLAEARKAVVILPRPFPPGVMHGFNVMLHSKHVVEVGDMVKAGSVEWRGKARSAETRRGEAGVCVRDKAASGRCERLDETQ